MQIVTDSAADLAPSQIAGLPIHFTTLRLSLGGEPFTGSNEEFYKKLSETDEYPVTSQAAAGEFAELYRKVSKFDPEILSIHISGGLSGTINSARVGASMVPEAKVTFWDSRTLSAALGWQVEAAARMVVKGFKLDKILDRLTQIRDTVDGMFSIQEMKYIPNCRPEIAGKCENMDEYDFIYLGFPIWCGTAPMIVRTFLESYDFSGKTIAVFATSGGGGMGHSVKDCASCCSAETKFLPGKLLNRTKDFASLVEEWK